MTQGRLVKLCLRKLFRDDRVYPVQLSVPLSGTDSDKALKVVSTSVLSSVLLGMSGDMPPLCRPTERSVTSPRVRRRCFEVLLLEAMISAVRKNKIKD